MRSYGTRPCPRSQLVRSVNRAKFVASSMLGIISRQFLHCIVGTYQKVARVFGYASQQKGVFALTLQS